MKRRFPGKPLANHLFHDKPLYVFVITGILYVSIAFMRTSEPPTRLEIGLGVLSLVLCPPSVLYNLMFDIDLYSVPGASIWLAIGLINCGLYAAVAWLVGRLFWKPGTGRSEKIGRVAGL